MSAEAAVTGERFDVPVIVHHDEPALSSPSGLPVWVAAAGRSARKDISESKMMRHGRAWMAIRGLREIILIAAVYTMYDATRYFVEGKRSIALSHAKHILSFEHRLHIDPETWLNPVVTRHALIALPSDYIYATLHYIVTPVVLVWMWRRHRSSYNQARSTLMLATIVGLIGFSLLPVAPPRMLDGFTDTMSRFAHFGWWSDAGSAPRGLGQDTNQYAALPSLHVGWAVWCGWQMWRHGKHTITRVLGVAYPVVVSFVVVATANHYFVDALSGFAVIAFAGGVVWATRSLAWRAWPWTAGGSRSSNSPPAPA